MRGDSMKSWLPVIASTAKLIRRFLATLFALTCLATAVQAAVELGVTYDFSTVPASNDFYGGNIAGGGGDVLTTDAMDTAVQARAASSITTTPLPTDSNATPATHGSGAYWSSVLQAPFTRPSGINIMLMMAVLSNNTASAVNTLDISYDLISGVYTAEEIPGHRVYYSLTGAAASWTVIAELSVFNSAVSSNNMFATIGLPGGFAPGSIMYLLWADDNGNGNTDGYNAIDNFLVQPGPPPGPPTITTNPPAAITVVQNRSTNLTLVATGISPLTYQWYKAGSIPPEIPGATNATFTITNAQVGVDDGDYYCIVSNPFGSTTSGTCTVTVSSDSTPPSLVSAQAGEFFDKITAYFDEPIERTGAEDYFNYTVSGGTTPVLFSSVSLQSDNQTVVIPLDAPGLLEENTEYTLTVSGITDLVGNPIGDNYTATFRSPLLTRSFLNFAAYHNISGSSVAELTSSPMFPDSPSERLFMSAFDTWTVYPDDSHDSYGARISGVFIPPESGNWIFYLSSDDASQLYFNPAGTDPAGRILLTEAASGGDAFSTHASAPQTLTAGQLCYIEAVYKENNSADYCRVAAKLETDPTPPDNLQPIPGAYLGSYVDPKDVVLNIILQPTNQVATIPSPHRFSSETFSTGDGGFTVISSNSPPGPWRYNATRGTWYAYDRAACAVAFRSSRLNSPTLTMITQTVVTVSFDHRYSFEADADTRWDGGQLRLSVNGGPYEPVPGTSFTANGYSGTVGGVSVPNDELAGQEAFIGESTGYTAGTFMTSAATLGTFNAGDTLSIQFLAAWDDCSEGKEPNWEITGIQFDPPLENRNVTFTVGANASRPGLTNAPTAYQWQRDDGSGFVDIPNAILAAYGLLPELTDNGATFRCVVQTPGLSVTSQVATLTVTTGAETPMLTVTLSNGQVVIAWPAPSTGYVLEQATAILSPVSSTVWTPEGSTPEVVGDIKRVIITPVVGQRYYRLRKP